MLDKNRRTGKTARMLAEAQRLASEGRDVYVIAATRAEVGRLQAKLPEDTSVKVETPGSPGNFDWHSLRLLGAHRNCDVLVDHHAIEMYWRPLLEMWQRFDNTKAAAEATEKVERLLAVADGHPTTKDGQVITWGDLLWVVTPDTSDEFEEDNSWAGWITVRDMEPPYPDDPPRWLIIPVGSIDGCFFNDECFSSEEAWQVLRNP